MRCETDLGAWVLDETVLTLGRTWERMISDGKDPFAKKRQVRYPSIKNDPRKRVKKMDLSKVYGKK